MKNKLIKLVSLYSLVVIGHVQSFGQNSVKPIKINLNETGEEYVKFTFLNQTWLRYTDVNPGTTVNGYTSPQIFDIGLRRTRMQVFGKVMPRTFFYAQFGMNNFSYNSKQFQGAFFHDAICEFEVKPTVLSIGSGLTGWSGISRYASPSVGTIMTTDAPLYQQATNGVNDQFLRKLSVYAKGKFGKLDYRIALSKPMNVLNAPSPVGALSNNAEFSPMPSKLQTHAYLMVQFFDQEDNTTPYTVGTYLGKKKVFNLGAGYLFQPQATWYQNAAGDTLNSNMLLACFDVFADLPMNTEKQTALTIYGAYNYTNFGPNYVRIIGVMNPATGVNSSGTFNGSGNSFPIIGTGNTVYVHVGYLMKKGLLGNGTLQWYGSSQLSLFKRSNDPVVMYEGGLNYLVNGTHNSKLSLNVQMRPIVKVDATNNKINYSHHRGMVVLQYQISI